MANILSSLIKKLTNKKPLEEIESKYRAVLDETYEFIGLMTPDGILTDANRTAMEFSGIKLSQVINKPFWEGPWWEHSEELRIALRAAINKAAQGEFIRFGATHYDKDKNLHYIDFSIKPVKDKNGKVIFLIPEGRDITDRKKMETVLRFDREVIRNMHDGVAYISAANDEIIFTNDRLDEILGYDTGALYGKNASLLFPAMEGRSNREVYQRLVDDLGMRRLLGREYIYVNKKGLKLYLSINISTVHSNIYGKVWVLIYSDVTARKKDEEIKTNLAAMINSSIDAIFSGTLDGIVTFWSKGAEEMLGYKSEEIVGRHVSLTLPDGMDDDSKIALERIRKGEKIPYFKTIRKRKDGKLIDVSLSISPMRDADGHIIGAVGIAQDISEKR